MKQKHFLKFIILFFISIGTIFGQARGDIAFTAINVDGDDDFAIVLLADLAANSTIFFTDSEWTEGTSSWTATGTDGFLQWDSGTSIIKAGTIIIFTDVDNSSNSNYGASIGTLSSLGNVAFLATGETIFAYIGTNKDNPTTFLTGMKNGNLVAGELAGTALGGTDLVAGTDFLEFNPTTSPDGGYFSASRSNQAAYANYLSILVNQVNWTRNTTNGEALLDFSTEAFTLSGSATTWLGAINSDWDTDLNWSNNIPTSDSNVTIPNTANDPIISTAASAGNVTLNTDASLTINSTLTNKGLTTINSSASLIASSGTITGNVSYKRNLTIASNGWHLVSSPVVGETIPNYNNKNSLVTGGTGTNIALATYNNAYGGTSPWVYETTASTGSFVSGLGYQTKLAAAGDVTFTGTMPTANVPIAITIGVTTPFNLIGNPYPSYVNSATFLTDNTGNLASQTIWLWDESANAYVTKVTADAFKLAPGQGFFVECGSAGNVTFTEVSQSHEETDTFTRTADSRPEIHLFMTDGTNTKFAKIYYINGTTTGFDNGYDGELFGGVSNPFVVYTELVSDNQGKDYQIQSLPDSNYENMVVPVGVNAVAGTELTFRLDAINIPTGYMVFLEDRDNNTFTRLDEANSEYKVTVNTDNNGIGRFYLHTPTEVLNVNNNVDLKNISLFTINKTTLRMVGLPQGNANVRIFSLLGKQVMQTSFNANGVKDITLPTLARGVYVVQLETVEGKLNKKIIIE